MIELYEIRINDTGEFQTSDPKEAKELFEEQVAQLRKTDTVEIVVYKIEKGRTHPPRLFKRQQGKR